MAKVGNRPQSTTQPENTEQSKEAAPAGAPPVVHTPPEGYTPEPFTPPAGDTPSGSEPPAEAPPPPKSLLVEVPFCTQLAVPDFVLHVDTRFTIEQSNILRRIAEQADRDNARLANGTRVVRPTEALKYILELVGAQGPQA